MLKIDILFIINELSIEQYRSHTYWTNEDKLTGVGVGVLTLLLKNKHATSSPQIFPPLFTTFNPTLTKVTN